MGESPDSGLIYLADTVYHTICEGYHGASIGKLVCRLRVITEDGKACSPMSAFIRNVVFVIEYLLFGIPAYYSMVKSGTNQRFGDRFAKTLVVQVSKILEEQKKPGKQFIKILLLASLAYSIIAMISIYFTW